MGIVKNLKNNFSKAQKIKVIKNATFQSREKMGKSIFSTVEGRG